jgi:hypothetical protein
VNSTLLASDRGRGTGFLGQLVDLTELAMTGKGDSLFLSQDENFSRKSTKSGAYLAILVRGGEEVTKAGARARPKPSSSAQVLLWTFHLSAVLRNRDKLC